MGVDPQMGMTSRAGAACVIQGVEVLSPTIDDMRCARRRIASHVHCTPVMASAGIDAEAGCRFHSSEGPGHSCDQVDRPGSATEVLKEASSNGSRLHSCSSEQMIRCHGHKPSRGIVAL